MAIYAGTVLSHSGIHKLHSNIIPVFSALRAFAISNYNRSAATVILLLAMIPVATNIVSPSDGAVPFYKVVHIQTN